MIGITDSQNFTDIAEAIRKKLENFGGGTMRPSEMAAAIESIDTKENVKQWELTIATEQTETCIILTDDWLKEYYADENLFVVMQPISEITIPSATRMTAFAAGNTNYCLDENKTYGISWRISTVGAATANTLYSPISTNSDNNRPRITANGELKMWKGVCAGTYNITALLT